jgi:outer membrane protein OmpA-like peptidoglycan-associated protein
MPPARRRLPVAPVAAPVAAPIATPLAALLLAACASSPPPDEALKAAGDAYEAAQRADAFRLAPQALAVARNELARARALADGRRNAEAIELAARAQADADAARAEADAERARQAAAEARALALARGREREAALAREAEAQRAAADAGRRAARDAGRAALLTHELSGLPARSTERGVVVTLGDVLFRSGSAALPPRARRSADRVAEVLLRHPELRLRIEGHTDSTGSRAMNLGLSRRRAQAVQDALVRDGVDAARLEVAAYGESRPVADNTTATGRQLNRRVELLFSDGQGRLPPAGP